MTNQNRILQNFRRDVPLQGLTAKAGGRLKGDIETGMVSCNRSGDKPLRPPGPALKETASTFRCGPTVRPDVPSAFPARHGQQGMSTGRHISRVHVETTAVTISRTNGAATSREAHPSDLDQAIFNDTARRPVSARPQSPRRTPSCPDPSVLSSRGRHRFTSVNSRGQELTGRRHTLRRLPADRSPRRRVPCALPASRRHDGRVEGLHRLTSSRNARSSSARTGISHAG